MRLHHLFIEFIISRCVAFSLIASVKGGIPAAVLAFRTVKDESGGNTSEVAHDILRFAEIYLL